MAMMTSALRGREELAEYSIVKPSFPAGAVAGTDSQDASVLTA